MKKVLFCLLVAIFCALPAAAQAPFALMPPIFSCFYDSNGAPYAGGFVATYIAGTSSNQVTYTDSTGAFANQNPVPLDAAGCALIWLGPVAYDIELRDSNNATVRRTNNVTDVAQILYSKMVLLNPVAAALQTVIGPLGASYFQGTQLHTTSPGVRVALLDPVTILDTANNPPQLFTVQPSKPGLVYSIPDPTAKLSNFVLNPGPADWVGLKVYALGQTIVPVTNNPCNQTFLVTTAGTTSASNPVFSVGPACVGTTITDGTVVWASQGFIAPSNVLDCTQAGLTCKRKSFFYFEAAGCNNTTSALGWDTFGTNSPVPFCVTGTNVQKGVMGFPGSIVKIQDNIGSAAAAGTVTTTYTNATVTGDLLIAEVAVDTSRTITGCTDGTNAYTKAVSQVNGTLDTEIWYFNGSAATKTAGTTLTCTLSAAGNAALSWQEYAGNSVTPGAIVQATASTSGTSTAITTGATTSVDGASLVLSAYGAIATGSPTATGSGAAVLHTVSRQATNIQVQSQGVLLGHSGVPAAQSASFTLSASLAWMGAIVVIAANPSTPVDVTAQRAVLLPPSYTTTGSDSVVNLSAQFPRFTQVSAGGAMLGVSAVCSAAGSTDDPSFLATSTSLLTASTTTANILSNTAISGMLTTGCAPGNLMHFRAHRVRGAVTDTFEDYLYLTGAALQFMINQ